ncbi:MAG: toprim domain-containing protein [Luteimonas sp.]
MADLVVIEAPGKLRTIRRSLADNRIHADVVATIGHVRGYDRRLVPLGISVDADDTLHEQRHVLRPNVRRFLAAAIAKADRVVIATDGDQEGHAIAADVAALVRECAPVAPILRMVPTGLDSASLAEAWAAAAPLVLVDAQPGIGRRVADRVFASAQSEPEKGRVIGRVQLGLLQLCADGRVCRQVATLPVQAADGGRPFSATVDLPPGVGEADVLGAFAAAAPARMIGEPVEAPLQTPMDAADALLALEAELSIGIGDAARLLQEMYESGDISYPRTSVRAYTGMGVEAVARLAQVRGILGFQRTTIPSMESGAHEAIRLVGDRDAPDLMRLPRLAGRITEGVRTIVGRRMVESGVPVRREDGHCEGLPLWADRVRIVRDSIRARPGWSSAPPASLVIRERSPAAALVAAMAGAGVGRPSTYASHASRFIGTGWVDDELRLTDAGREVLDSVPGAVRRAAATSAFEAAIEAPGTALERAERALAVLGVVTAWGGATATVDAAPEAMDRAHAPEVETPATEALEYEDEEDVPAYRVG